MRTPEARAGPRRQVTKTSTKGERLDHAPPSRSRNRQGGTKPSSLDLRSKPALAERSLRIGEDAAIFHRHGLNGGIGLEHGSCHGGRAVPVPHRERNLVAELP